MTTAYSRERTPLSDFNERKTEALAKACVQANFLPAFPFRLRMSHPWAFVTPALGSEVCPPLLTDCSQAPSPCPVHMASIPAPALCANLLGSASNPRGKAPPPYTP